MLTERTRALQSGFLAKVSSPEVHNVVFRERLFQLLDQARKKRIIWVTGLPGSGKTTLVASYAAYRHIVHGWYQLDSGDTDLATFFYYLRYLPGSMVPAVSGIHSGRIKQRIPPLLPGGKRTRARARSSMLPLLTPEYFADIETFTHRYFEELYSMLPRNFMLVFDNYHAIDENALFHTIMLEALGRVPDHGNVLVISRTEPLPVFSRLRANSVMEIIGNDLMRFTPGETDALIKLHAGQKHTPATASRIQNITDGWAAGIILMLEQHRENTEAMTNDTFKDYQSIFRYFSDVIFDSLEPDIRDFLMRTALFPSMTVEMATSITGNTDTQRILNALVKYRYFTISRPDHTYTYHDLFRAFLMERAKLHIDKQELRTLYHVAARLLEDSGKVEDAVALLAQSDGIDEIMRIIKQQGHLLIAQGRNMLLESWIRSLPEDRLEQEPWLSYWLGEASALFNPPAGRMNFEKAFAGFLKNAQGVKRSHQEPETPAGGIYLAWCGIVETFFYEFGNYKQTEPWIASMERIMTEHRAFPSLEIEARVLSLMVQVLTFQKPDHPRLPAWAQRALSLLEYIRDPDMQVYYLLFITNYFSWTGNIVQFDLLINFMKSKTSPDALSIRTRLMYKLFIAVHARHLSLKQECLAALHEALALAQEYGVHFFDALILAQGIYLLMGTGDTDMIEELLQRMGQSINQSSLLDVIQYNSMEGWLENLKGRPEPAIRKIEQTLHMVVDMGSPFPEAIHRIALAELYSIQGDHTRAQQELERALSIGKRIKSFMIQYMGNLLRSSWLFGSGPLRNEEEGVRLLRTTMGIGRKYGIINTFLETREIRSRMCMKSLELGIEVAYVQTLIRRLELIPEESPLHYENWPWFFRFCTLGNFRIYHEKHRVELSRKAQHKPIELLQYLIVNHERPPDPEALCSALWPDAGRSHALRNLNITIHRLRKLLGSNEAVLSQGGTLLLNPQQCWVDVVAFQYLLGRLETLIMGHHGSGAGTGKPEAIENLVRRIFSKYKGEFFTQEAIPSWAIGFRERTHNKFIHFINLIADYFTQSGFADKAIQAYKNGLDIDNFEESFYQNLMILYISQGRSAEAAALYKRCESQLMQTMNREPSEKTQGIYRSLVHPQKQA